MIACLHVYASTPNPSPPTLALAQNNLRWSVQPIYAQVHPDCPEKASAPRRTLHHFGHRMIKGQVRHGFVVSPEHPASRSPGAYQRSSYNFLSVPWTLPALVPERGKLTTMRVLKRRKTRPQANSRRLPSNEPLFPRGVHAIASLRPKREATFPRVAVWPPPFSPPRLRLVRGKHRSGQPSKGGKCNKCQLSFATSHKSLPCGSGPGTPVLVA